MQLFAPERHEALIDDAWDASVAASAIREIVADTLAASRDGAWPAHPLDDDAPAGTSWQIPIAESNRTRAAAGFGACRPCGAKPARFLAGRPAGFRHRKLALQGRLVSPHPATGPGLVRALPQRGRSHT
jgi:hypothetical protein